MLPPTLSPEAGKWLRAQRERLRLSTRDVERLSYKIAQDRKSQDFYISHAWLTDTENGNFTPNFCKLYSLCLIYRCDLEKIFAFLGISLRDMGKEQKSVVLPNTHLVEGSGATPGTAVTAPLELRDRIRLEETNLVSRMFQRWGEIPVGLLQQMDLRTSLYGYIGIEDYRLYPIIRPGSFVQIDSRQRKITRGYWRNDFDRPIYFVELRDSYVCSWCELDGSQLILVPSPQSREQVRHVRYPGDADIVGRVTAVTMRIAEEQP